MKITLFLFILLSIVSQPVFCQEDSGNDQAISSSVKQSPFRQVILKNEPSTQPAPVVAQSAPAAAQPASAVAVQPPEAGKQASGEDLSENAAPVDDGGKKEGAKQETASDRRAKKELIESLPLLEIKKLEGENPLYSIELRNVELADLFRILAHDYDLNIILDKNVKGTVTASFTGISLEEALQQIADSQGLIIEKQGNVIVVKPNLVAQIFVLKYVEAKAFLTSDSASMMAISALLSKEGKSFLANQPNSIMVIDYPQNLKKIAEYIEMSDKTVDTKVFKLNYLSAKDVAGSQTR